MINYQKDSLKKPYNLKVTKFPCFFNFRLTLRSKIKLLSKAYFGMVVHVRI